MRALRIEDDNVYRQTLIATGDLVVNLDDKTVVVAGTQVYFTKKEYQVLELLCLRKGTVLTKDMFLKHIYGGVDTPGEKIIDVFMCSVRKKLAYASNGKDYIQTFRGRGYTLRRPTEDDAV